MNKQLLLSICLSFPYFSLVAQYNRPHIINFSKDVYQAANKNWSIGEDEQGVMYFGNDIGLLTFDGVEWRLNSLNKHALVRSVAVASHKTIFTGGYEEFGRWDRNESGKLEYTSLSNQFDKTFKNDDFWKIWIATDSLVYFQSFNGIYYYDYRKVKKIDSDKIFLFLSKVRDKFIVQEMRGSLYWVKRDTLERIANSEIFHETDVRVILPYSDTSYLIGTAMNGVYLYDGSSFREWNASLSAITKSKELNSGGILSKNGFYYLGTILDGIYVVNPAGEIVDHLNANNILQDNTVLALFEDDSENVWAGLDRGISYIQQLDNMSYFSGSKGSASAIYDAVLWNKKLFLGTNQGVFYVNEEELNNSTQLDNMRLIDDTQGQVWSLKVIDDKLYCNHNRGLKEIKKDLTVKNILFFGTTHITEHRFENKDVLLVSTYSGLRLIDKETGKETFPAQVGEPISKAEIDHLANLWLEHSNKGVYKCRINSGLDSLYNINIYGGTNDSTLPFELKIFKVGGRIVLLGNGHFYTYNDINDKIVANNALNNCFKNIPDIKQVVYIQKDLYWALSGTSIFKFSYDGYNASILEAYNISANNLSLINSYENISVLNDSLNLICLDNGFLIYNHQHVKESGANVLTPPYIESIKFSQGNGDTIFTPEYLVQYIFNTVDFRFSAKNLFTKNLFIQYKLIGIDKDWSSSDKINHIQYERLPKGNYTFQLRCTDNLGNYSDMVEYHFEILPPWYQSNWAYFSYVILIMVIIFTIWWSIVRHYEKLNKKRTKELESKKLKIRNQQLQLEVERKNSELMTQASFFIRKNELILKLKNIVDDFYQRNKSSQMTELYRRINALLNNNLNTDEDWKMFLIKFEEKHTGFFRKMKQTYPDLTNSDLRLCACLKLNMETKDIASLMNISVRAVENSRYRLRKKFDLQPNKNLTDFILSID